MNSMPFKFFKATVFFMAMFFFQPNSMEAQPPPELRQFSSGLVNPLGIVHAGDERLFVLEKRGTIRALDDEGNYSGFFLDIRDRVRSQGGEQGLLGLAFHPEFHHNGWFFVYYTNSSGASVVSRFSVDSTNTEFGDNSSENIILQFSQPFSNHNGGQLLFGPDGYLYIFSGDGGSGGDPLDAGQDPLTFLGKILRIDVNGELPYSIPEDNPFAGTDFELDEIWALGLRNPWRNSFDRLSGDLWIADVGQSDREEINFQPSTSLGGENYGWRCYEGNLPFNLSGDCDPEDFVFPVYEYVTHGPNGCSITGGYVYRGEAIPDWFGSYIFGDFCTGLIFALEWDSTLMEYRTEELFNIFGGQLASFGEDVKGELYVTHYGQGRISKIVNPCNDIEIDYEWVLPDCWDSDNGILDLQVNNAENPVQLFWSDNDSSGFTRTTACGIIEFSLIDNRGCLLDFSIDLECREELFPGIEQAGDSLLSDTEGVLFRWFFQEDLVKESEEPYIIPGLSGMYFLEVIDENDCIYRSDVFEFILSSSSNESDLVDIKVFPNPAKDEIFLKTSYEKVILEVNLYSSDGRKVKHFIIDNPAELISLSIKNQPQGWYLLELVFDNQEKTNFRIFKEN